MAAVRGGRRGPAAPWTRRPAKAQGGPSARQDLARKVLGGRLGLKDALDDPSGFRALTDGLSGMRES
ncbi:hypothetical protein ACWGGS_19130 [Streptomyces decoyicus]